MDTNVFENGFCKVDNLIFRIIDYKYVNYLLDYVLLDVVEDNKNFKEDEIPKTIKKEYHHPDIPEAVKNLVNLKEKGYLE